MSSTRIAVAVCLAPGLALVARTAQGYAHTDQLALALTLIIGLGLLFGGVELWLRAGLARQRGLAVSTLPSAPEVAQLRAAPPVIRAWIDAALAGRPAPVAAPGFTPFLLGLVIMVGMLGTFMGLVDTMGGARDLLASSRDAEVLRAGLGAPLSGLTRAFGTSVAGVAASASLGLAAVVVRRAERAVARRLADYAVGPLQNFTPLGRQVEALERLAHIGLALPEAAQALNAAVARLDALAPRLAESQAAMGAELSASVRAAGADAGAEVAAAHVRGAEKISHGFEGLQASLAEVVLKAAAEARTALTALSAETVAQASAAAGTALEGWTTQVAAESKARQAREAAEAEARTLGERIAAEDRAARELAAAEALHARLATLGSQVEGLLARSAEAEAGRFKRFGAAIEALQLSLDAGVARAADQTQAVARVAADQVETLAALEARTAERLGETVRALGAALTAEVDRVQAAQSARAESAASAIERVDLVVAEHLASLDAALLARTEPVLNAMARVPEATAILLRAEADRVAAAETRHEARLVSTLAGIEALAAAVQAGSQAASEAVARLAAEVAARDAAQVARLDVHTRQRDAEQTAHLDRVTAALEAHAQALGGNLGDTAKVVAEAGDLLRAGGAELSAVAEMFADAVDRYRENTEAWQGSLARLETAVRSGGEGGDAGRMLDSHLDQTREVFADAMRFQRELFAELRALREGRSA